MKKSIFYFMAFFLAASFVFVSCDDDQDDDMNPPKSESIVDVAAGDAQFSTLVEALKSTGLDKTLDNENNDFTVFAPTNAAFSSALTELGYSSLGDIPKDDLTQILLYHVMAGENLATNITSGYYSSMSPGPEDGYNLSLYVDMENTIINDRANITATDVMADNGVIHVVDKVLLPLSITGHAVANPAFSSLAAAVTKAGLADALADPDIKYTVFAPMNSAFDALLADLGVSLDDLDAETLTPILLYHAVDAFVPAANVESGYVSTLSPSQGRTSSLLITADGPLTVFAPTNNAFDALFTALSVSGIADLSAEDLTPILLAHVVEGNVASTDLSNGDVPTLNTNKSLSINVDDGVVIDDDIKVIVPDVQGTNGIVHAIDKVIVP